MYAVDFNEVPTLAYQLFKFFLLPLAEFLLACISHNFCKKNLSEIHAGNLKRGLLGWWKGRGKGKAAQSFWDLLVMAGRRHRGN
jgi:hypothetical protein